MSTLLVLDLGHAEGGREEHPLRGGRAGAIPGHGAAALTRHGAAGGGADPSPLASAPPGGAAHARHGARAAGGFAEGGGAACAVTECSELERARERHQCSSSGLQESHHVPDSIVQTLLEPRRLML